MLNTSLNLGLFNVTRFDCRRALLLLSVWGGLAPSPFGGACMPAGVGWGDHSNQLANDGWKRAGLPGRVSRSSELVLGSVSLCVAWKDF